MATKYKLIKRIVVLGIVFSTVYLMPVSAVADSPTAPVGERFNAGTLVADSTASGCTNGKDSSGNECGCQSGGGAATGIDPDACDSNDPSLPCEDLPSGVAPNPAGNPPNCTNGNDIVSKYVNAAIDLLAALVGVVAAASIIAGGIQYSTSAGDPQKAAKAKNRITNALLALIAFAFLWGFLQFIIPGGIANGS